MERLWVAVVLALLCGNVAAKRSLAEYDCTDKRARTLYYAFYAGQMRGGELVLNGAILPGLWSPVFRGSVVEKFWNIACS